MQVIAPLSLIDGSSDSGSMSQESGQQNSTVATRIRRYPICTALLYRESSEEVWSEGTTVNISRSGVLFRAAKKLELDRALEMQILLPAEITGADSAIIVCRGRIIRTDPPSSPDGRPEIAAAIRYYRFQPATRNS